MVFKNNKFVVWGWWIKRRRTRAVVALLVVKSLIGKQKKPSLFRLNASSSGKSSGRPLGKERRLLWMSVFVKKTWETQIVRNHFTILYIFGQLSIWFVNQLDVYYCLLWSTSRSYKISISFDCLSLDYVSCHQKSHIKNKCHNRQKQVTRLDIGILFNS